MNDDLIEAVAMALAGQENINEVPGKECSEWLREFYRDDARAAIRAAAPLILDMAAKEAQTCGFTDRESLRNSISYAIRQLKERFQ